VNRVVGLAGIALGLGGSVLGALSMGGALLRRQPRLARQAVWYVPVVLLGTLLSVLAMERALLTNDFSLSYVADVSSRSLPTLFKFAALWASLEGSILLWALVLSGYITVVAWRMRDRLADPLVGWALTTLFAIAAFFFALMAGPANPFREIAGGAPFDGAGGNPLLQNHVLMAIHPPMLYLGYVGFSVPFAFAVAALVTSRVGEGWLLETRRWTLFAWGFLTIGILLGAWWSYEVLGWGGFWAWDPVENASFLPWLTGTAYLHSVLVQERRGMLRVWNLSLLAATFSLTILGTFLTRSGVIDSVHSFSESGIGPWLLAFFGVVVAVSIGLIGWRGDRLRSPGTIDSPLSREGAFLANNVLFGAFAFVILLGTVFPLVVEAINDDRISVGRPFFDTMTLPIGLALLTLMAIAPVLPWRKASGEVLSQRLYWPGWVATAALLLALAVGARGFAPLVAFFLGGFAGGAALRQLALATRRQGWRGLVGRANGGMIVHVGVIVVAIALTAAQSYSRRDERTVSPGESWSFAGHTFTYEGVETVDEGNHVATKAKVRVDGDQVYEPAWQRFASQGTFTPVPSVRTGLRHDVYLTFESVPQGADGQLDPTGDARIGVLIMPLALWLWIGGGVMAGGTALAAFPGRRRRPTDPASALPTLDEPEPELVATT